MLEGDRQSTVKALRVQATDVNRPHRAEATPSFMEVACPQRILYLPPSPPYTDPRLKISIFLPSLDDHPCVLYTSPYLPPGSDMDSSFAVTQGKGNNGGISPLLSPPYSPRRGLLQLTDVEREPIELLSPGARSESSTVSDDQDWRPFDDSDFLEQQCVRFKDIDLGGESDDEWDQPSFLKATPAKEPSDGLDLNLFGAAPTESSPSQCYSLSSPRTKNSELPPIEDLDAEGQDLPIFKSSDFDVFQNDWDQVNGNTNDLSSDGSTILDEGPQIDEVGTDALPCFLPESPSRRTSVGLPDVGAALEATGLMYSTGSLFLDRSSIERSLQTPPQHHPADIPSEAFQSPYSFPFILSSPPPRSPPLYSLLFAPAEPQNASAHEYPESCLQVLFNGDLRAQSYLLEESRLRAMKQEMNAIETQARSQEAMLTDYIARLNAMKPPSFVSSNCNPNDTEEAGTENEMANVLHDAQFLGSDQALQPMTLQASAPVNPTMSFDDFYIARRREVQNAVSARASERRRRKQAKERARELEALLLLKAGQIRDVERWMRTRRERVDGADEPVVLAASGSDRHPDHTNSTICDDETKQANGDKHGDEVRQLVAKMIFRRRDSSRPLSGKSTQPIRSYVSSSLSQELEPHADDADDLLRMEEESSS